MNPIRAIIAEDEPMLSLALQLSLQQCWPALQIIAQAANGLDAIQQTLSLKPEVLFLDIKMPGKDGIQVAQELAEEWPENLAFPLIVYVTAYNEFALDAFEHAAIDYLLKPVSIERLQKTVRRLQDQLQGPQPPQQMFEQWLHRFQQLSNITSAPAQAAEKLSVIKAAVGQQIRLIPIAEVIYFEASDKYISVVTAEHTSLIRMSLRELLPQLDATLFWQIHRGTVVNSHYIQVANREDSGKLRLTLKQCPDRLLVSRLYAHLFRQM